MTVGNILYTSHLTNFGVFVFCQMSILMSDEKLKKTNNPKTSQKVPQILLKYFSLFVTRYTKTGLTTQSEMFSSLHELIEESFTFLLSL